MDWTRFRALGFDLLLVGVLVLLVAAGFSIYDQCPASGSCSTVVDWVTLSPAIVLVAMGAFLTYMARRKRR